MRPGRQARPVEDRFWEKVRKTRGCWYWTSTRDKDGYGRMRVGSRTDGTRTCVKAHHLAWELHHGRKVPKGKWVLHHCDRPPCVRPDHLYVGTAVENGRDLRVRNRSPKRKLTHCKHGHPFSPTNTYWRPNGTRACQKCRSRRSRNRARPTMKG